MWRLLTSKGQAIPIRRLPGVLGSAASADVRVPHESVKAAHARLSLDEQGALLVVAADDEAVLGVDGRRVRRARLLGGEALVIGKLHLRVEAPGSAAGAGDTSCAGDTAAGARAAQAAAGMPRPSPVPPDDAFPQLELRRKPAGAPAAGGGRPRAAGGSGPRAGGGTSGARPKAPRRHRGQALVVTRHERRGLLGTDLSQLSWGLRFGLLALLLVLAAAVAWALGLGIDALA